MQYATFPDIGMKQLLPKISDVLSRYRASAIKIPVPTYKIVIPEENNETITQAWFWPRVAKFFKPKDLVVAETGGLQVSHRALHDLNLVC